MAYKVFISHSTQDRGLVISLANLLSKFGADVLVAEWYLAPSDQLEKKISGQIENANCVVVLLTKHGVRSSWMQQEIGYALKSGNPIIPLVEKGSDEADLGPLRGKEYIEYDPRRPEAALLQTSSYVRKLNLEKEEREKALLIAGGILAFLLLLSGGKE